MTQDIENMLRRLPLAAPSDELDDRVLPCRPRGRMRMLAVVAPLAAVAAGLLFVLAVTLGHDNDPPPQLGDGAQQARSSEDNTLRMETTWSNVVYGGITTDADGKPLRAYHTRELRQVVVLDESGDQNMVVTIPTEKIILVQAETY